MRQISIIVLLLLTFNTFSQDTVVKQKLKINEIAIVGTLPIISLYNYSSNQSIIFSALDVDEDLSNFIKGGYSDTSKATKMLRPLHYLGPFGGNIGI